MTRPRQAAVLVLGASLGFGCAGDDDDGAASAGPSNEMEGAPTSGEGDPCEEGCVATVAAACANGPATRAECVQDCQDLAAGPCSDPYRALQACAEGEAITCNAMGIPTIAACSDEQSALVDCLN